MWQNREVSEVCFWCPQITPTTAATYMYNRSNYHCHQHCHHRDNNSEFLHMLAAVDSLSHLIPSTVFEICIIIIPILQRGEN